MTTFSDHNGLTKKIEIQEKKRKKREIHLSFEKTENLPELELIMTNEKVMRIKSFLILLNGGPFILDFFFGGLQYHE